MALEHEAPIDLASPVPPVARLGASFGGHPLLDHLVRRSQQRLRDGEAERFGGLEVDDQIDFGWL